MKQDENIFGDNTFQDDLHYVCNRIKTLLGQEENCRVSWSMKYPRLMPLFVEIKRFQKKIQNYQKPIARKRNCSFKKYINIRHQSVLMRKLGNCDMQLQKNKIKNIALAIQKINGLLIQPGEIFSFWELVGRTSHNKGFLDGILISRGKPTVGIGGGLCQLSNLLYRMFLHADFDIIERHRHSYDIFPDSGRVLPFGTGATVFYNYLDLQAKNIGSVPIQIKLWLDGKYLKGQLCSDFPNGQKIHIVEDCHFFVYTKSFHFHDTQTKTLRWRYNVISKEVYQNGKMIGKKAILENICPVQYPVSKKQLQDEGYSVISL